MDVECRLHHKVARGITYLNVELIKRHDGTEVEEREIEVVLEQLQDAVVSIFPLAVLQSKAHATHDSKPTASVEENGAQLEVPLHKTCLKKKEGRNSMDVHS